MIVGDLVDQHVVDESAVFVEQARILDLARLEPRGGVGGDGIGQFAAPPDRVMSISPIWLTSKAPTLRRTARCSSTSEEYWTGMSQPPKSTILAFIERCTLLRQVAFRVAAAGIKLVL